MIKHRCRLACRRFFSVLLLLALGFANCAVSNASDDFIVVEPKKGDTFTSLATVHLGDPSKDWLIQDFNQTTQLVVGKKLVIPVRPYNLGGLTPQGYQRVPVLSYHQFSKKSASKMRVTASDFDQQMKFLKQNGYRVITIDQFFDFLELKVQIPKKAVLITIDDGYRSVYDIAYPILKTYAFPATIFIYTDFIGSSDAMSWDQLEELSKNGFSIQSQSKTHRDLTRRKNKESFKNYIQALKDEINSCRELLKTKLNIDSQYLAYPYGKKNDLVVAMLMKAGFRGAFTAKRVSNPFFAGNFDIGRAMILGKYDLKEFEKNLVVFTEEDLK